MVAYEYGNPNAVITLVQPVDDHDIAGMDAEVWQIFRNFQQVYFTKKEKCNGS